ncbi:YjaG family protein [Alteromonas sp. McT4-15]|uniref:YjaG family protein n=1 Tax=Alteromonas sp. McT4-15 TaxID=2881256 RepID=UPI001CF8F087|nr:YjaG family protein [Alteromonas sp. McT4-15]MCB4437723.1 YjaG family protein [Alteromonas sp. McT4-15]MEC8230524.1 YjaG family protein [Pseudomonadota bacterium]
MAKQKLNTFGRVRALEGWKAVAFGAALLERMLPNYALFCEVTETGDATGLRNCLNLVWESLKSPKSKFNVAVQLEKVEVATPDTSEFDNYGVYPAIDAAIGLAGLLNLVAGDDPQGAVVISKLSQGSVEAYLLATDEADDESVKSHPLMEFEVEVQNELLDYVEQAKYPAKAVDEMKQLALEAGISNIGLEM